MKIIGLILSLFILVVAFTNCSKSYDLQITAQSPFVKERVQLSEKAFEALAPGEAPTLKPDVRLLAKVNNLCAKDHCASGDHQSAITCQAFATGVHPSLADTFQIYRIQVPRTFTEADLKAWVEADPIDQSCLRGVSQEIEYQTELAFNDTNYSDQRNNLQLISFEDAQAAFTPASLSAVKVGVIDTGVASDSDIVVDGRTNYSQNNVANGSPNPLFAGDDQTKPNHFHGTFVAGIIGATQNNSDKMTGIAPNAHIYAYGIGTSQGTMSNLEIANAIQGAVADNMEVVNMSFGTSSGGGTDDPMVRDGIVDGLVKKIIFVAASGNSGLNLKNNATVFPAQYSSIYDNVISVAAADVNGFRATFSNYGGPTNIMAPGSSIYSINPSNLGGGVIPSNGTSFAAPMVSAAVALTIGNLKKRGLPIDPKQIRTLVTVTGANQRADLTNSVLNGAFLDLKLLGAALTTVQNQTSLSSSIARGTDASGNGTVQISITWNTSQLTGLPANARLGVFDLTSGCNFSSACLITSFAWPVTNATCDGSGNCSLAVVLTRAQVIAMMSGKTDPTATLPLVIAVYHPVTDPATGKTKNNYAVDYSTTQDLRNLSSNTGQPIQGVVENVRMDMANLYVQGWTCRPLSEEAVPVSILDQGGTAIVADYAYDYGLMVPHSALDYGDFADFGTNVSGGHVFSAYPHAKPYKAEAIQILQKRHTSYAAGLEGNAQLIIPCGTLTASHGFEFVIPLDQIRTQNLAGQSFTVKAGGAASLADSSGATSFSFPEPPPVAGTNQSLTVGRSTDAVSLSGAICSGSPSPIVAEISYASFDYVHALTTKTPFVAGEGGLVFDPTLTPTGPRPLPIETVGTVSPTDMTLKFDIDTLNAADTSDALTTTYLRTLPNPVPNAAIFGPSAYGSTTNAALQQFVANVNAKGFKRIVNGEHLTYFRERGTEFKAGTLLQSFVDAASTNASANSFNNATYLGSKVELWDYYDVGELFSTNLVGYNMDSHYYYLAQRLNQAYKVKTVLREAKKFETPLARNTVVLANQNLSLTSSTACGAGSYQHTLPIWTLANAKDWAPFYTSGHSGFWIDGTQPVQVTQTTVQAAMEKVPMTIRFFQDGKMILHVESDTASTFYNVPYTF